MSGDPLCKRCGHPASNHPYRHQFVAGERAGSTNTADLIGEGLCPIHRKPFKYTCPDCERDLAKHIGGNS